MYITPSYETSLDPDDAIALNPNEIPLVTFRKRIIYRLGQPYGQCRKRFPSGLTHFKGLFLVQGYTVLGIFLGHFELYSIGIKT